MKHCVTVEGVSDRRWGGREDCPFQMLVGQERSEGRPMWIWHDDNPEDNSVD